MLKRLPKNKESVLRAKVQPRSSRNEILEVSEDGSIRVRVTAAPEAGKANAAMIKLIADFLGTAKSNVILLKGEKSREKTFLVRGISEAALRLKLASWAKE